MKNEIDETVSAGMFSDHESENKYKRPVEPTYTKKKKVLDKWAMLEAEREEKKARSPKKRKIDPNVPNWDLIEEMMEKRE